jgi:hypothetical protein
VEAQSLSLTSVRGISGSTILATGRRTYTIFSSSNQRAAFRCLSLTSSDVVTASFSYHGSKGLLRRSRWVVPRGQSFPQLKRTSTPPAWHQKAGQSRWRGARALIESRQHQSCVTDKQLARAHILQARPVRPSVLLLCSITDTIFARVCPSCSFVSSSTV